MIWLSFYSFSTRQKRLLFNAARICDSPVNHGIDPAVVPESWF